MSFVIRAMRKGDVDSLGEVFARLNKEPGLHEKYWRENQSSDRMTIIALVQDQSGSQVLAGYGNVVWASDYKYFGASRTPEVNDLHVLEPFRKRGIATAIIRACEAVCIKHGHDEVGIGFGLLPDDGVAQRLYVRLGFVPDGRSAQPTPWGMCCI